MDKSSNRGNVEATCNVCGTPASNFKEAPGGRMALTGVPPVCPKCGSLERHRIFRSIVNKLRTKSFSKMSCLMFSRDPSVAGGWFKSMNYSVYGTKTSLDVQNIELEDASVDVVICNHILEHVPNYIAAMQEIARIITDYGFALITFPNPHYRKKTVDWGYPKPEQHNHYRVFGEDVEEKIPSILPFVHVIRVIDSDPVTLSEDRGYIITYNDSFAAKIFENGVRASFINIRKIFVKEDAIVDDVLSEARSNSPLTKSASTGPV